MKKLKVAVLMGGASGEREVSLASGMAAVKALAQNKKFDVLPIEVTKQGKWLAAPIKLVVSSQGSGVKEKALVPVKQKELSGKVDVAFIAMHGKGGEDGTIQGLLELLKIPYTGSGVLASALGMDKVRSLALFRDAGLLVPNYTVVRQFKGTGLKFKFPVVTKPNYHGSSLGVSICRNPKEFKKGIALAKKYNKDVIVQQFIDGIELTCAVLGNEHPKALPVVEIIANKGEFYDYASKYEEEGSDHIIPARIPKKVAQQVQQWAIKAHQTIGCRGFSRTDFIYGSPHSVRLRRTSRGQNLYVLEINTIPGLTPTSLFPDAAKAGGHKFPELIEKLIHLALEK